MDTRILGLYNYYLERQVNPEGYPHEPKWRVMSSRVDLEGTREIIMRRGRSFLALPQVLETGRRGHIDRESLLVTALPIH